MGEVPLYHRETPVHELPTIDGDGHPREHHHRSRGCPVSKNKLRTDQLVLKSKNLIPVRIFHEYSVGPFIRPICTICCFTMTNIIVIFTEPEYLSQILTRLRSLLTPASKDQLGVRVQEFLPTLHGARCGMCVCGLGFRSLALVQPMAIEKDNM